MKKDSKVVFLNNKNIELLKNKISKEGKYKVLSEFATFFERRTYFKVSEYGDVAQKEYNPICILFSLTDNVEKLAEYIFKYSYTYEKQNIKKIDRMSNLEINDLKKGLMKTLVASNLDFCKRVIFKR